MIEEIEVDQAMAAEDTDMSKKDKVNWDHTPIKNKNTKRSKVLDDHAKNEKLRDVHAKEDTVAVLRAIQELTQKMDDQTQRFIRFEKQINANSSAIDKNKKDITELQSQVVLLKKENAFLKSACDEHARYKRRWNLRLTGLPEKDEENVRETVIGILTRIIPVSVERLRDNVDTEARRRGKRAYLKEGYALIDNKRVDPD
ncbi:hypothetical protein Q8A67_004095 [Cirrhinus molitorella]|uniref:Uncharacterized protein n=1 Tax=Cirrhinus molitorella TaxID=172907 RepID=A0AA88QB50_9TELE|nr:hypothetical protein Q8A67_004095 [Cirrhinus molitorella]